ncbi:hypothetical protein MTsPCn5_08930 [Croceitalea sp. MTPC5]|jgi:hypothetical protein|nr:hypothetical protein [Allomuricauda sp.]MBO6747433.1 hypothetical protein [Allomuricauda sp.]GMN05505.1 hypothetical protein MTsPCn5_08930 [Croceitalea sp. MTPC5]
MRIRPRTMGRIPKPDPIILFLLLVCIPICFYGQFDQLLQEAQDFKNDSKSLSREIIDIIKIIAGTALGIMALAYIYIRNQQTDLADKLGKAIIGIAIFFAMIAIGEEIANI